KAMEDRRYRELGGVLQHVLDAIRMVYERGFWLELVTLVVPGFNDDSAQLRRAADYIASVSPEIPWHVTAFHKDYRMTDPDNTTPEMLVRACEIGAEAGLKVVYAGNVPGRVGRWEHTWRPDCGDLLVERTGYVITRQRIGAAGRCPACRLRPRGAVRALSPGAAGDADGGRHGAPAARPHLRLAGGYPGRRAQGAPRQRGRDATGPVRGTSGRAWHPRDLQCFERDPVGGRGAARHRGATGRVRLARAVHAAGPRGHDVPPAGPAAGPDRADRRMAGASGGGRGERRQRVQTAGRVGERGPVRPGDGRGALRPVHAARGRPAGRA